MTSKDHLLLRFKQAFHKITHKNKVAIYHDADGDGTTAAALVETALRRQRGRGADLFLYPGKNRNLTPKDLNLLRRERIDTLFVLDIAIDNPYGGSQSISQAKEANKHLKIIVFDHHSMDEDISSQCIFIKTVTFAQEEPMTCTAKLVYDFLSKTVSLEDKAWVASIGMVSDVVKGWDQFYKHVFTLVPESEIRHLDRLINYTFFKSNRYLLPILKLLAEERPYEDIKNSLERRFRRHYEDIEQECQRILATVDQKGDSDLRIVDATSTFRITGIIANELSFKHTTTSWIILRRDKDLVHISTRRQDGKVDMPKLLQACVAGMPHANAGGHVRAAGAAVPTGSLEEFLSRLRRLHDQFRVPAGKTI